MHITFFFESTVKSQNFYHHHHSIQAPNKRSNQKLLEKIHVKAMTSKLAH